MKPLFPTLVITLLLAALASAGPNPPRPAETGSAGKDTVYSMGEVVVTAARTSSTNIEVPMAISVVGRRELSQVKGFGLDEALSGVPGVLAQARSGNQDVRITIRGFGARGAGQRSNAGTSRGVRIMVDGLPETEPDGRTSFDLVDLSGAGRIEVIRSNASALWGNASGGVVNIRSNTEFDSPYTSVQAMFGSFGFQKQTIQAGANIGEGKFFLSLANTNFDGWREHSRSFQTLLNTGIETPLTEATHLGVYLTGTSNSFRIPGALTPSQFAADPSQAQDDPNAYSPTYVARDERRFNRLGRLGATLSHDIDASNNVSVTAFASPKYLQRSERNSYRDFTRYHVGGSAVYRNTARVSEEVTNTFQVGADEAFQDGAILFYNLDGQYRGTLRTDKREGANTFGAFAQDELVFSEQVSLLLGARYDKVTYTYENYYEDDPAVPLLSQRKRFERVTPKAGLTYRFSPSHSVYANLGGGIEVPAGNETDPPSTTGEDTIYAINPLLDASWSTTLELGTKQILSLSSPGILESISYDVALYWVQVKNDIIPYRGGRFYFTAGESRRMGIEVGTAVQFTHGLSLDAALTIADNKYVDYTIDSVHYGNPGKTADLKDNKSAGIPDLFYNVKLRFVPEQLKSVFAEVSVQGVGKYFADDYNTFSVPPFTVVNAVIGTTHLTLPGDRLFLSAFAGVNNLFDRTYAASAWVNPDLSRSGEPIYLEAGLPRNFIGSLSLGWEF